MLMSKKQKPSKPEWRLYLGMLVVIAVVLGVFLVAMTAFEGQNPSEPVVLNDSDGQTADLDKPDGYLLVAGQSDTFLLNLRNLTKKTITWPDDVALLGEPLSQISGVDCVTGQPAWLDPGFAQASSTIFRSPDGRRDAQLNTEKRPVGGSVMIKYGNSLNSLVLRLKDGRRIAEPQILGWLNKDELVLAGKVTSTLAIYTLNLSGGLSRWSYLPSDATSVNLKNGRVYYLRPVGSSDAGSDLILGSAVWMVHEEKPHEEVLKDQDDSIGFFLPWIRGLVYATEERELFLSAPDNLISMGKGHPLISLGQDAFLVSDEGGLYLLDKDGRRTALGISDKCSVFFLPKVILDKYEINQ